MMKCPSISSPGMKPPDERRPGGKILHGDGTMAVAHGRAGALASYIFIIGRGARRLALPWAISESPRFFRPVAAYSRNRSGINTRLKAWSKPESKVVSGRLAHFGLLIICMALRRHENRHLMMATD